MLDLAIKYEKELQELFANISMDEKYMFLNGSSYRDKYEAAESTWSKHEFVSMNTKGEVIGYIKYSVDRESNVAYGLQIVNFSPNKVVFGRDTMKCLDEIFTKFKFRKLSYNVYIGNPVEKTYDRLTNLFGGRIIGISLKNDKLLDGNYYDSKAYEIFRDDYINNKTK